MVKLSISVLVAAVCLVAAQAAPAATPFTVGQGAGAHIVVSTDGSGHVVWGIPARGGTPAKIGYCHLPAGASACDVTQEFNFPRRGRAGRDDRPARRHHRRAARTGGSDLRRLQGLRRRQRGRPHLHVGLDDQRDAPGPPIRCLLGTTPTTDGHPARRHLDRRHQHLRLSGRGHRDARLPDPRRGRLALPGRQRGLRLLAEHGPRPDPRRRAPAGHPGLRATSARSSTPTSSPETSTARPSATR